MALELVAERFAAGGAAIAREASGRVVFVEGALPGERVEAELVTSKRDFARAHTVRVLEASPHRVAPPCPQVAAGCGGCGWQHIDLVAQRGYLVDIVADALRRIARLPEAEVRAGDAMPGAGVRTTVRLAVDRSGRSGFRAASSHRVVPTDHCLVAHPLLDDLLALDLPGLDEAVFRVALATGERTARWSPADLRRPRALPADVAAGPGAAVHEDVAGVRLRVSSGSFFQSSPVAAEAIVTAVRHAGEGLLGSATTIVDAYAGVGLFGATVVPGGCRVVSVESSASSSADARVNLADRSAEVVETAVEHWSAVPADLVIADPARAGLGRDAVDVLAATGCERLVLVSCDAAACARDTRLLIDAGFDHAGSVVLDPFPHTAHVEVVTRFDRRA